MSRLDYSKWDHIEISDDEDDIHPNIDTGSLFRWRHQARVERMEEAKKEKDTLTEGMTTNQQKMMEVRKKLKEAENSKMKEDFEKLNLQLGELEKQELEWKKKEEELKKKEKMTPLNIDTICHEGKSKTLINKSRPAPKVELTDDEKAEKMQKFSKENEKLIKKFGMFHHYSDSEKYLTEHPHLACEETANYLVIWCINLQMEEKHNLMEHVSHQTIVLQFILELAKTLDIDPKGCIRQFFAKIKLAEKQYMEAFNDELGSFKQRIRVRAEEKVAAAMKDIEEEERQKRLGPGGLDPIEVMESLPKILQDCFESKDIELLQKTIGELPYEEAKYHMKRCVDSGLWVPGPDDEPISSTNDDTKKESESPEKEPLYSDPQD